MSPHTRGLRFAGLLTSDLGVEFLQFSRPSASDLLIDRVLPPIVFLSFGDNTLLEPIMIENDAFVKELFC
jgi:hypothetical protein